MPYTGTDTQEHDENRPKIVCVSVFIHIANIKTEKILYITTLKQFDIKTTTRRNLPIFSSLVWKECGGCKEWERERVKTTTFFCVEKKKQTNERRNALYYVFRDMLWIEMLSFWQPDIQNCFNFAWPKHFLFVVDFSFCCCCSSAKCSRKPTWKMKSKAKFEVRTGVVVTAAADAAASKQFVLYIIYYQSRSGICVNIRARPSAHIFKKENCNFQESFISTIHYMQAPYSYTTHTIKITSSISVIIICRVLFIIMISIFNVLFHSLYVCVSLHKYFLV